MTVHPVSSVEEQRAKHFPWEDHPYAHFFRALEAAMTPESTILDIGCGREANTLKSFEGKAGTLVGVDLDPFTREDDQLQLYQESATSMPSVADSSIDLAYSASVMEHIKDMDAALQEIRRVLKPGCKYIWLAPNLHHYAYFISSIVPNFLHPLIVNLTEGREKEDVFPAFYKINTRRKVFDLADAHRFSVTSFRHLGSEPQYLAFSRYAYFLGSRFENFVRARPRLHWQLGWILCEFTKPE